MERFVKRRSKQWIKTAYTAYDIKQEIKTLTEHYDSLMRRLKTLSHNKNSSGGDFIFKSYVSKGAVNYKAIPELKQIDLDQYRKDPIESWKLERVKE